MGLEVLPLASLGEVKSNRNRLGPGVRYTRALKCESDTGQRVGGKPSSRRLTVRLPSRGCVAGSEMMPYMRRTF